MIITDLKVTRKPVRPVRNHLKIAYDPIFMRFLRYDVIGGIFMRFLRYDVIGVDELPTTVN